MSGVPRDKPLDGQSMWNFAAFLRGCAERALYFIHIALNPTDLSYTSGTGASLVAHMAT